MRRLLVVTVAQNPGPIEVPLWLKDMGRTDVFVLNPFSHDIEKPVGFSETELRETFLYSGETGLKRNGDFHVFIRAYNEELRRNFKELLRWGSWDALVINGALAVLPILGDKGLEVPRGLSWLIYRETPEDRERLAEELSWRNVIQLSSGLSHRRFRSWHEALVQKSAEVVKENPPTFQASTYDLERAKS